ncbi:MAG: photosynthetic complex putative assembly protein PuhB, partial [Pseudomonadota bacterium]
MADHGHHDEEFDLEPVPGLPEAPPAGERILWQGAPDWRALARRCFLSRWTAAALLGLGLVRVLRRAADGAPMGEVAVLGAWHLFLAAAALGVLSGLAWMTARATVYNITDRRVAMRIGSAVNVTFNLPFRWIDGAELAVHADGAGNIPLTLRGPNTLGYLMLWPHCRPWRMARPQPMLRCIPQ